MSTKAQAKTQIKTPTAPTAARIAQPPITAPEHQVERPDITAQLEGAALLGHSLEAVSVRSAAPRQIQARSLIQRQSVPEDEDEEEELQLQRELTALQRQELPEEDEEEEELQMKQEPAALQRQEDPEQEEEEEQLQMQPDTFQVGPEGGPVAPEVETKINRARGGGQLLDGALQNQMGEMLGYDFSGVQVHIDAEADALNQQLSARAFTTGRDIFFRQGEYSVGTESGRELLSHELSHVVQQDQGRVSGGGSGMTVRPATDTFEQEANVQANAVKHFRWGNNLALNRCLTQRQRQEEDKTLVQRQLRDFDLNLAKFELDLIGVEPQPTVAQASDSNTLSENIKDWSYFRPDTDFAGRESLKSINGLDEQTVDSYEDKASEYLNREWGGAGYDETRRLIVLSDNANRRTLIHELGHHKQVLKGITDHSTLNRELLEFHNIVVHENRAITSVKNLRVTYTMPEDLELRYYEGYKRARVANDRVWNKLVRNASIGERGPLKAQEKQMVQEMQAELNTPKYTQVNEGWNLSVGDIIKKNMAINLKSEFKNKLLQQ